MTSRPDEAAEDAAIVRLVVAAVAAAVLCLLAGGVAGVVVVRGRSQAAVLAPGQIPTVELTGGIGPLQGALVVDYVTRRSDALRAATGRRGAVISFVTYRTVSDARAAVGGTDVQQLLVALPAGRPLVVPADPAKVLAAHAASLTKESEEMTALANSTDDPAFKADYQSEACARRTQAAWAGDVRAEIVFGVVVVADVTSLRTLARAQGVRLVDVAAGTSVPDALRGLRPEEAATAGMPPERPE